MKKIVRITKKRLEKMQAGQVLVFAAAAIVALIAIIGLAIDGGVMFIEDGKLRRAIDAAAISAALQYRADATTDQMKQEARQFLLTNGVTDLSDVRVVICDPNKDLYDPDNLITDTPPTTICAIPPNPQRKLVYVFATAKVHLAFLPVIGINEVTISSSATSEAASVDVVLLLDRSESMTYDAKNDTPVDPLKLDPSTCNALPNPHNSDEGYCQPFDDVKQAAIYFVDKLNFPFDRVSVITFDKHTHENLVLSKDEPTIIDTLKKLSVYYTDDGEDGMDFDYWWNTLHFRGYTCDDGSNHDPCRNYLDPPTDSQFQWFGCPTENNNFPNGSLGDCTTTNIGEALARGAAEFNNDASDGGVRQDAVWVIILLTDGGTNAGYDLTQTPPVAYCPGGPTVSGLVNYWWNSSPGCRPADADPTSTRYDHATRATAGTTDYDPYAYALDWADQIHDSEKIFVFTIGLGKYVTDSDSAQKLLAYIAQQGRGNSYITPNAAGLHEIFVDIANNIATRLQK